MSMSLDGFIAGPNDGPGNGLGDHGHRLHEWFADPAKADPVNRAVLAEAMTTGAVVVGRRTFDLAEQWGGDHHDGVPIVLLTRRTADEPAWDNVTYVDDVRAAMRTAKDAAGDKDVLVHGAVTAQLALAAGVLDEVQLHVVPVLLGQGRRLFDATSREHVELELLRARQGTDVLHLRYRVRSAAR
jgi:dihydrofolate reductase